MGAATPGAPGIERREHRRVHYVVQVEIEWGSSKLQGHTANISLGGMLIEMEKSDSVRPTARKTLGGMLIEMENPLWVGAEFLARIFLEKDAPLEAGCVVRRVVPGVGMGVEFTDMKSAEHSRLRQLMEDLPR